MPSDDSFDDQVIGGTSYTHTHAKIQFPVRGNIQIDGGKKLLLLFRDRVKAAYRAQCAIVFKTRGKNFGEILRDCYVRRELKSLRDILTVK